MVTREEFFFPSKDEKHLLHAFLWQDRQVKAKGILQISHGMIEYIGRYDEFATYLAKRGFIVAGHDHLGHGQSVNSPEEWGYFTQKDGSRMVVEDIYKLTTLLKKKFSSLPYYVLGHSMGSFMIRRYMMTYGKEIDGVIIMGTGKQSKANLIAGKAITTMIKAIKGEHYRSQFIADLMFGTYNKDFGKDKRGKEWLTREESFVAKYINEPSCSFLFTLNGVETLLNTILFIHDKHNISKLPKDLPMYIVSGAKDPVGNYGKGPRAVYEDYKAHGVEEIVLKLYPEDRHEILNEKDRGQVYEDIACHLEGWLALKEKRIL
ncbi:alpha/beta hydrolase [Sporanaerobium hydrogeniformans]|uniref:Alpha/beta hydrolase n=1 Tax=Sporanaerobium hydrogeniformans TaxID=3072179 RepID=A0AC61DFQ8_9FIRM|nr:alpha/beta hydrolase [Sporanaerobium hydrogeniformans]PHV72054.1 alpha/beta hydrolase [Sporanaerobium hydrogeniformans]